MTEQTDLVRVYRPWGWYEVLSATRHHHIKRLYVLPGTRLSLQSHQNRAELWCVVAGAGTASLNGHEINLGYGASLHIPKRAVHRLANPQIHELLVVVEVQTGEAFDDADIVRYEDDFGRT